MMNKITNKLHRYFVKNTTKSEEDMSYAWLGWDAWVGIAQGSPTVLEHVEPRLCNRNAR